MVNVEEFRIGNTVRHNGEVNKIDRHGMVFLLELPEKFEPVKLSRDYFRSIGGIETEMGDFDFGKFRVFYQQNIYCQIYTGAFFRASYGLTYIHEFENWHRWTQGTDKIELCR